MVSIASGDPSDFRTAAFMVCSFFGRARILAGFTTATRPGIILGLKDPASEATHDRRADEFQARRTFRTGRTFQARRAWRLPAVAAREADAEGRRLAGGATAADAGAAAGGGGRTRRHRRRLVHPPRAGTLRQSV